MNSTHKNDDIENKVLFDSISNFIVNINIFFRLLLKKKLFFFFNTIVFSLLIGSILYLFSVRTYISTASFIAPDPKMVTGYNDIGDLIKGSSIKFPEASSLGDDPNEIWLEILRSNEVSFHIVKKFNLIEKLKVKYIEDASKFLEKAVTITSDKGLIKIKVKIEDSKVASEMASEYVNKLQTLLTNINLTDVKQEKEFLEKHLSEVKGELSISTKKLTEFQVKKKMLNVERQGEGLIKQIAEIQSQIIKNEAEMTGLKTIFTENSPKVKALFASNQELKTKLAQIRGKTNNEATINSDISLLDFPSVGVDYIELSRDVKILEQVLISLTKEYEIIKIKESKTKLNLKLVDIPTQSEKKYGFEIKTIIVISIFLGICISLISLILLFLWKNLEKSSNEINERINQLRDAFKL